MITLGRPCMARGTGSSNPVPSTKESANFRYLRGGQVGATVHRRETLRGPRQSFAWRFDIYRAHTAKRGVVVGSRGHGHEPCRRQSPPTGARAVGDVVAKAWVAGDDAPADWSLSRSGGRARVRSGAESTYLAGGVLQLLIAQLRRHIVLLGQR